MAENTDQKTRRPAPGFGRVRLRKKGKVWHVRYRLDDGARVSESLNVTQRTVAEGKAKEINDRLERGEIRSKADLLEDRGRTFKTLADAFLTDYPRWSDRTRKSMGPIVNKLVAKFGERPLDTITTQQLISHLAERVRKDGLDAKASYNRYRSTLSTMMKWAVQQGWLAHSPVDGMVMAKEDEKEPNPYSEEELARLLAALPEKACAVAIVAVSTGMRKGELQSLVWYQVRFDDNVIRVVSTKAHLDRSIPLAPEARAILEKLKRERLQRRFGSPVVDFDQAALIADEPVFGAGADILKAIKKTAREKDVGITGATQHRLRDTFGTRCFDVSRPSQEVQRLLGHKTNAMTMRYAKVREHRLHEAIGQLPPLPLTTALGP
jgi:integrase